MRWIDMRNAMDGQGDNFGAKLFRLIFKADTGNSNLLEKGFPLEVTMVRVYKYECPYKDNIEGKHGDVDFEAIERIANDKLKAIVTYKENVI